MLITCVPFSILFCKHLLKYSMCSLHFCFQSRLIAYNSICHYSFDVLFHIKRIHVKLMFNVLQNSNIRSLASCYVPICLVHMYISLYRQISPNALPHAYIIQYKVHHLQCIRAVWLACTDHNNVVPLLPNASKVHWDTWYMYMRST